MLADLKPRFIHDPRCKELIAGLLAELGCDTEKTYFDVPRLRTMAHGEYLKAGLAYQFHPHRDTWFSAPFAQLNWWLPVYPIDVGELDGLSRPLLRPGREEQLARLRLRGVEPHGRKEAAKQITKETRKQPSAEEPIEFDPQTRVVTPVGGALIFSAAHLHSTVPNTTTRTRFSIDFRTVDEDDLIASQRRPERRFGLYRARRWETSCARAISSLSPDELISRYGGVRPPQAVS